MNTSLLKSTALPQPTPMDTIRVNEAQRRATVPTQSCWVMASAGTGKTKILIDRILRLLLNGAESERLVCITYTKAAALEMSERLLTKLHTWSLCDDETLRSELLPFDVHDKEKIARTLFHTVFTRPPKIQTIHSFCQSLLSKNPFVVDLLPDFSILSDPQQKKLIDAALDRALKDMSLNNDLQVISNFMGEAYLKTCLRECLENRLKISSPPDLTRWIGKPKSAPLDKELLQRAAHSILNHGTKALKEKATRFLTLPDDEGALFDLFLTTEGSPRKGLEDNYGKVTEAVYHYKAAQDIERLIKLHESFHRVFLGVLKHCAHMKKQKNVVDVDDVLFKARALLKDNHDGEMLRQLDASFDHLMLDEAQDTSPLQWEILLNLLNHFFDTPATNDQPRTVFIVGDLKQSIYSFQGAEPERYLDAKRHLIELLTMADFTLEDIDLTTCYRSTPEILNLVDEVLLHDVIRHSVPKAMPHHPHRMEDRGHVELWPLLKEHTQPAITPWHLPRYPLAVYTEEEALAQKIATRIDELIESHMVLPTTGKSITASDIFVLVKRRTALLSHIDDALKKRHIPCAGLDRITLAEHLFVKDFIAFLTFLDLPQDDLNLASLLKSPFLGFSEEDLIRLCANREKQSLWAMIQEDSLSRDAVTFLRSLLKTAQTQSPYALTHAIIHCILERAKAVFGSIAEDLSQTLLKLALNYESQHTPSIAGLIAYIHDEGQNIPLSSANHGERGVRLMTIHGAKGLEAPVVIMADTGDEAISTHSVVLFLGGSYIVRTSHAQLKLIKDAEKKKLTQENHRLLYVAMTRARDYLILCGIDREVEDSWHALVAPFVKLTLPPFPTHSQSVPLNTAVNENDILPHYDMPLANERIIQGERTSTIESDRGTALHKLFELISRHGDISDEILQHPHFTVLNKEDFFKVQRLHGKLNLSSGYSELSITTRAGQMVRLDFVKIEEDALTIIDYKSTRAQHTHHVQQMLGYNDAVRAIFPNHIITLLLVYMDTEEIVEVSPLPHAQHMS